MSSQYEFLIIAKHCNYNMQKMVYNFTISFYADLLNGMEDLVNVDSALLGMHNVMMLPSDTDFAGEASPETVS